MRPTLAVSAIACVLALGACGSDDSSNEPDSPAPRDVATQPAPTDGENPTRREERAREGKRAARPEQSRRSQPPSESLSPAERIRVAQRAKRIVAQTRRRLERARRRAREIGKRLSKEAQPTGTKQEAYQAAKKVCGSFLPNSAARGRTPEEVARSYARAWPGNRRQAAEEGCLAGLRQDRR